MSAQTVFTDIVETKPRKKKSSPNEKWAKNLDDYKESKKKKEKKEKEQLEALLKAVSDAQNADKSKSKAKPGKLKKKAIKKELTPEQKEKRDRKKAERKNSFPAYMGNKIVQDNKTYVKTRINEAKIKDRQEQGLDRFKNPRTFYQYFTTKQTALNHVQELKQGAKGEIECPYCQYYAKPLFIKTRNMLKCRKCTRQFSMLKDTIFAHSHIPLHYCFDLMFNELFNKVSTTVKEAANILECSMKSAHAVLTKVRLNAFLQKNYKIKNGSILVIDTMSIIGRNHNRPDYAKLHKDEIYEQSIQVLSVKIKGSYTLYFIVKDLTEESILAVLCKILPDYCTVICDEHASFDKIDKIENKKITLIRVNHSAGDHGDGSAESANARLKNPIKAHGNVFSVQGVQGMANLTAFKANTNDLSINQKFDTALMNCLINKPQAIRVTKRGRRSSFVKLITALQKLNPEIIITATDLQKITNPAKIIKMADAITQKERNERKKKKQTNRSKIQSLCQAA